MSENKQPQPERDLMRDYLLGFYGGIPRIAQGTMARTVASFWDDQHDEDGKP